MARSFIKLKLRLLANGLRGNWQRALGLVLGTFFAIPLALAGFALLAGVRGNDADGQLAAVLVFALVALGWAAMPVLGFGNDETLDPARLALLPLGRRDLLTGLSAASLVGIAPVATLFALLGSLAGYTTTGLALVVVPVAVAVELALCIVGSRAVVTALAGLLRSRRGRDATLLGAASFGILVQLSRFLVVPDDAGSFRPALDDIADVLRWTPPGLAGGAMADAAAGRLLPALAGLAVAAGTVVLLAMWWNVSLSRALTTSTSGGSEGRGTSSLFSGLLRRLPRNPLGAGVARELRYLQRDPRRRVALLSALVLPIAVVTPVLLRGGDEPGLTLAAAALSIAAGQLSLNQFGLDGAAAWSHVSAGADVRTVLTAKNAAATLVAIPMVVLGAVLLAAVTGGWAFIPVTVVLALAATGVQLGVADVISVRAPQSVPENQNPWATNAGNGCLASLIVLGALLVQLLLLVPVVIVTIVGFATNGFALGLGAVGALVYGAVVWHEGRRRAARWLEPRQPELLEAVAPSRA